MRTFIPISLAFISSALAQTPTGTFPATNNSLDVVYNATKITPGISLPSTAVAYQPDVYSSQNLEGTYMIFMFDLSIPDSDVTTAEYYDTLVPGLGTNRTTRLHWWGGNYTLQDGLFVNSSVALAEYTSPRPREGDIAHSYILYLFDQPTNYTPSAAALAGEYYSQTANSRFNISVLALTNNAGPLLAANYFTSGYTDSTSS